MPYAKTTSTFSNEYYLLHGEGPTACVPLVGGGLMEPQCYLGAGTDEDSANQIAMRGYDLEQAGRHAQDRGVCVCHNFVTSQCDSCSASDAQTWASPASASPPSPLRRTPLPGAQ